MSRTRISSWEKKWAWEFTQGRCWYCGQHLNPFWGWDSNSLHWDHIVPVKRGGTNDISNIVPACADCNRKKGALTAYQFRAKFKWMSGGQQVWYERNSSVLERRLEAIEQYWQYTSAVPLVAGRIGDDEDEEDAA